MRSEQHEAYEGETEVYSDALGLIKRDNRNHRKKQDLILDVMNAEEGDRVLEVGCGHGLHSERYAELFDFTGMDLSTTLAEETQQKIGSDGSAMQGDALSLDFSPGSFDSVVGTGILHHLPDARAALDEWLRVTALGGSVTLMEPNYLFPKDFVSAHLVAEERHKTQMAPWRVRRLLREFSSDYGCEFKHRPALYTPPWPTQCQRAFDVIDALAASVPGARWMSQMQLIHVEK